MKIISDLNINFNPLGAGLDLLERDSSAEKLFSAIQDFLKSCNVDDGYIFNENDDGILLTRSDGYWLVVRVERGEKQFIGIFYSFIDATEFFISRFVDDGSSFNWEKVFS